MSAAVESGVATDVVRELERAGVSGVDATGLRRALYSSDASLYRVPPRVVVVPRHTDELAVILQVARATSTPLTMRGAGTSIAGNAVGPGIVVDTSRHLNRVLAVDPEAETALVEPGVVQANLQKAVAEHGLRFGPDPSTHNRATIGGMIGNNACGSRALGYGRTSDNVVALDVVTGTGEQLALSAGTNPTSVVLQNLRDVVAADLAVLRTELGQFGRQVSGYSLEHLLPERGFDVAKMLVGSEGTLALTQRATVRLVRDAPVRVLVALGYPGMAEAADAIPAVLPFRPVAAEGLDLRIVDVVRSRRGPAAVPPLPRGEGFLMVELVGENQGEVEATAKALVAEAGALDSMVVTDAATAAALWKIREDGAGLAGRTPDNVPAHPGWEDAAVPPERLGAYLREFETLMGEYHLSGVPYGHFGDGCVHVRIDFPFDRPDGRAVFRDFLFRAGALAAEHGGSMSGEHGDGRARGELLPLMYSPAAIKLFERVKAVFDPEDVLNPGVIVRPAPVDADVRVASAPPFRRDLAFSYSHDHGDLSQALHRCTGVGKCRADTTAGGGVMCPSFLATRDEKDSTRGRARVLQEVVAGRLAWNAPEVADSLDLCLSCKGCSSDCPTGVDMATYKAEATYQKYRRKIRPRSHYALGQLPRWTRLVGRSRRLTRLANAGMRVRALAPLITWSAGVDRRRSLPVFAPTTFRAWFAARDRHDLETTRRDSDASGRKIMSTSSGDVVLFVDTFTDAFSPEVGQAAVQVLEDAGYRVQVTKEPVCCGLTWISTGQLDGARKQVGATVRALAPFVQAGAKVVGLEPSCTAVLRGEGPELLRDDDATTAREVAAATLTLAELLAQTPGWTAPDLTGVTGVAQPHCHHHAVMGWEADRALLKDAGASVTAVGGCCGLAGNFGVERGHHDVSVAVAEHALLPAVHAAAPDGIVLADGFSCRTQLESLSDRRGEHLAQLLARHGSRGSKPES